MSETFTRTGCLGIGALNWSDRAVHGRFAIQRPNGIVAKKRHLFCAAYRLPIRSFVWPMTLQLRTSASCNRGAHTGELNMRQRSRLTIATLRQTL